MALDWGKGARLSSTSILMGNIELRRSHRRFRHDHWPDCCRLPPLRRRVRRHAPGDDAWRDTWVTLTGPLQDGLDVGLGHGCADFPVDDETAVAVAWFGFVERTCVR